MERKLDFSNFIFQLVTNLSTQPKSNDKSSIYACITIRQKISGNDFTLGRHKDHYFSSFDELIRNEWFREGVEEEVVKVGNTHMKIQTITIKNVNSGHVTREYTIQNFPNQIETRHNGFETHKDTENLIHKRELIMTKTFDVAQRPFHLVCELVKDTKQPFDMKILEQKPLVISNRERPCDRTFCMEIECYDKNGKINCEHSIRFDLVYILNNTTTDRRNLQEQKVRETCDIKLIFNRDWMSEVTEHVSNIFYLKLYQILILLLGKPIQSQGNHHKLKFTPL